MTNLSRWIGYGLGLVLAAGFGVALAGPAAASPSPTTTTLTSSATTPLVSGQPVTFTATVAEVPPGSGVPSGTVTFAFAPTVTCAGGVTIEPLVAGTAQCTTTGLLAAQSPEEVTASYLGDTTDAASSSSQYTQPVGAAATTVTVSSSAVHPAFNGMGCSTTASVTAVTCSSLSGLGVGASVSDVDGAIPPGTTVASVVHTAFTLSNAATVTESGDTLTFVNDPTRSLPSGHPALFTATVALAAPATGTPSGTVTWTITGADASVVACANGTTANVNRRTLVEQCRVPQGVLLSASSPYAVSATYSGDASYAGSGGTFSQIINPATTRAFVAGTRIPVFPGTAESFTAAVVPSTFGGPPTGSATFAFAALPFKVNGCNLSSGTSTVNCAQGALSGVVAGYDVTDVTTPGAIPPGATVLTIATRAGSATLSAAPSTLTGQQLLFTPDGSGIPRADCNGGDTLSYAPTGTTCTVATGFPSANAVWGLVVTYSGDLNDGVSSSRQMKLTVQ